MAVSQDKKAIQWLNKYLRYTNYIAAAQLYLKSNCTLKKPLKQEHIKERVLGHWGTVPGQNFIYAHLNYLLYKHPESMLFIAGPGHGAPAVIANLFVEGTLAKYYPDLKQDHKGISKLISMFSWPGGFPSHTNPGTPGAILEGGELGYSLATAYGAVLDNPALIAACVIGDGEAETGPLATAWHGNKFLNPRTSGAVLPILHVNGYKITGPTIYATMSDQELTDLFHGFGYQLKVVNAPHTMALASHQKMIKALEWAYHEIKAIQRKARTSRKPLLKPRWPMIILRTLKGDTGIKNADGHKIEGSYHSHGIPLSDPVKNKVHFELVKKWLESYRIRELLDDRDKPKPEVLTFLPGKKYRMGQNPHANGGALVKELVLPVPTDYGIKISKGSPCVKASNTETLAKYIRDIIRQNQKNFRFYCPDETESNKFMTLFEVTDRAYMWPVQKYDENIGPDGRVMEVLSEHNLQGWLQGYLLTGRHGIFATYEAFAMIVASMVDQYAKFIKQMNKVKWRAQIASLNYILTSVGWRQEHNGYSHQNPSFVSNVLEKHGSFSSVYFPADANSLLVIMEECLKRKNSINVIVAGKQNLPQWLTMTEAREELRRGVGIWEWLNPAHAADPDIVFAASGDCMVQETLAAIKLLSKDLPELKTRFVNISELTALGIGDENHPLALNQNEFIHYFTADKPIIYNFHGYPGVIKKLIFGHPHAERFSIHGYMEEGSTTTPMEMMMLNRTSRYHLAIDALHRAGIMKPVLGKKAEKLIHHYQGKIAYHENYIKIYGKDEPELDN